MKKYIKEYVELDNNEKLAYVKTGKGSKTVLLLHGNYSSSLFWTPLMERLEDECTFYAPDFRGYGDSTYNKEFNSIDELAEDVFDFCKKLGINKAIVAGWSMGGGLGMSLAIHHSELVEKLLLVDSMSCRGYPIFESGFHFKPIPGNIFLSKEELAADPFQTRLLVRGIENKNYSFATLFWDSIIFTGIEKPNYEDTCFYLSETFKQRCVVDSLWALAKYNISDLPSFYSFGTGDIHKIKCPMVAFFGTNDVMVPPIMAAENCACFPFMTKIVVPGSGHAPIIDNADLFSEFFKENI